MWGAGIGTDRERRLPAACPASLWQTWDRSASRRRRRASANITPPAVRLTSSSRSPGRPTRRFHGVSAPARSSARRPPWSQVPSSPRRILGVCGAGLCAAGCKAQDGPQRKNAEGTERSKTETSSARNAVRARGQRARCQGSAAPAWLAAHRSVCSIAATFVTVASCCGDPRRSNASTCFQVPELWVGEKRRFEGRHAPRR